MDDPAVVAVLEAARAAGHLGPGDVERHVAHALGFLDALDAAGVPADGAVADLGSGGGLPGLVLARSRPALRLCLIEGMASRASFLAAAVDRLGLGAQVTVLAERAEETGRSARRGTFDAVVARSFGPPAVLAECAAPLLRMAGALVASEPPEECRARWDPEGLALLGLEAGPRLSEPFHYQVVVAAAACPARYPRRVGIPAKRPLF